MTTLFSIWARRRSGGTANSPPTKPDQFNFRPLILPVVVALVIGAAHSFLQLPSIRAWFLLEALCVFPGIPMLLIWTIIMLVCAVTSARQRKWKTDVSRLAMSICVGPLVILSLWLGPYIHFGLSASYYLSEVRNSAIGATERTSFSWGGSGFVGSAQTDRWLVYDPTNTTAMRIGGQKEVEGDPVAVYVTEHLLGNFYLVTRYQ